MEAYKRALPIYQIYTLAYETKKQIVYEIEMKICEKKTHNNPVHMQCKVIRGNESGSRNHLNSFEFTQYFIYEVCVCSVHDTLLYTNVHIYIYL